MLRLSVVTCLSLSKLQVGLKYEIGAIDRDLLKSIPGGPIQGPHERKGPAMAPAKTATKPAKNETLWEEIQPFTQPITLEEGEQFDAQYLGGSEVTVPAMEDDGDDSNPSFEEDGKWVRKAMLHEFQNEGESEPFGLWGSAVLDKRLAEVPANSRVRVKYEGKAELEGGRTARRYRVWIDRNTKF